MAASNNAIREMNYAKGKVDLDLKRTDTGIHTVEGNVAGSRAARLTKRREEEQQEYEAKKRKIQEEGIARAKNIDSRFNTAAMEFSVTNAGLHTKEEFAKASSSKGVEDEAGNEAAELAAQKKKEKREKKKKKRALAALSFGGDDDEGGGGEPSSNASASAWEGPTAAAFPKKRMKNPNVETDFLPDREREEHEQRERERLKQEWIEDQARIKNEQLEVTYSYWDGSGHRRSITVTKGTSIGKFLESVRQSIAADFHELRTASSGSLLYIKEDLIIPHQYTFYDLIVTKARGKSGPLFHFDVHDDVRMTNDSRVEKDESHPGKIVERSWYERNKHIFPASRWEVYDPSVERGTYTIHGGEVNKTDK